MSTTGVNVEYLILNLRCGLWNWFLTVLTGAALFQLLNFWNTIESETSPTSFLLIILFYFIFSFIEVHWITRVIQAEMDFLRYSRQMIMPQVGSDGQKAFQSSKVLVVGAGGIGATVAMYLAGAGIPTDVLDFDKVEVSNLHR